MKINDRSYTPALGQHDRTGNYDKVISIMTRERRWRGRMLCELSPQPGQIILDIGSGTGSFAILVKQACPDARLIAVDPDPEIRRIAETKAQNADVAIDFITAFGDDAIESLKPGGIDIITCSLVLHQCPSSAKIGILDNAYRFDIRLWRAKNTFNEYAIQSGSNGRWV